MGKYRSMRKCKETGEVAVMTRARAAASVSAEEGRKRKVSCGEELSCSSRSLVQLRNRRRLLVSTSTMPKNSTEKAASSNSNDPYASCCSSNGSTELDKDASNVDLEEKEDCVKIATSTDELEICSERRETTPSSSEVRVESAPMDSTARSSSFSQVNSHLRRSTKEKMPSQAELEEFFSKAEKNIHQQFAQKYNFDVVKEKPLEGRYEWVRVKP